MANTTILADPQQLSKDDLVDEYEKLAEAHRLMKISEDRHLQQNHELKRSLQTATNAETYLSAELDSITSVHNNEIHKLKQKHLLELDGTKKRQADTEQNVLALEGELEALRKEVNPLRATIKELKEQQAVPAVENASKGLQERLSRTEQENIELLTTLEGVREQLNAALKQIVHHESRIEDLRDQLECVQATLDSKREDLDEKSQLYENAQEMIFQLNGELAALKTEPETDHQKRGNSLFAEVDDQRQKMRQVLAAQKKHYLQMKQEFMQGQQEIRSLKRENAAMHKELQICSSMFMNADKTYKDKLNERIGQLLSDNQKLESKLGCTESMLVSMANENGVTWLDSMLKFCKNETEQMKEMLRKVRLQKSAAEETVHNVTQDMARWRFEALKSRCVIINRETLLEEHQISFESEPKNVDQMAATLDTSTVRPNINDSSARILQSSKNVECLATKLDTLQPSVGMTPPNLKSNEPDISHDAELDRPTRIECVRMSKLIDPNLIENHPIKPELDIKPETISKDTIENECYMDISIPIKTEDESSFTPIKMGRSPLRAINIQGPSSELFQHPSNITYTPQYRKISMNPHSMASLEKSLSCMKTLSTPRRKSARHALQFTDPSKDRGPKTKLTPPKFTDRCQKVLFSESTIEADELKEQKLATKLSTPTPRKTAPVVHIKAEPNESFKPKTTGVLRRVVLKSKKPTAFPK